MSKKSKFKNGDSLATPIKKMATVKPPSIKAIPILTAIHKNQLFQNKKKISLKMVEIGDSFSIFYNKKGTHQILTST